MSWFIILIEGTKLFSTHTDSNDYGVGIIGIFISLCQWISVIIASVIGTCLNKTNHKIKKMKSKYIKCLLFFVI